MKILHTSDWHLGQKFLNYDRKEEHTLALDWLEKTIIAEGVDLLIVSGDIFDIGNPPSYARNMYYQFLTRLHGSTCRHIVVIGGNHDSPSMLNAPKELLQILDVHVVGAATQHIEDEIIVLKDPAGQAEAVIAAVPFLRDRDLRYSIAGESGTERMAKVQEGIVQHFQAVAGAMEEYKKDNVPLVATGHLYAKGALATSKQDNIYIGDKENIEGGQFPTLFDYIALGHIHRAQIVGEKANIRYSGSLIPLSFSEIQDSKLVLLLDFSGRKINEIREIKVPRFRELVTFSGTLEQVKTRIKRFDQKRKGQLKPWVDILIETDENISDLDGIIRSFAKDMWLDILKIRIKKSHAALENLSDQLNLDELSPEDVFLKKCESNGLMKKKEKAELLNTFRELRNWMQEEFLMTD